MTQRCWGAGGGWLGVLGLGPGLFAAENKATLGEEEVAGAFISRSRRCHPCVQVTST